MEVPLRVTFDSNAYRQVVKPEGCRDAPLSDVQKINGALKRGTVLGYLSQTIVTLEGIENKDRMAVLGSTHLESRAQTTGENMITISMTLMQDRKPLNPIFSEWVKAAQKAGLSFLRTGSRWFDGSGYLKNDDYVFFKPDDSILAFAERMDKINAVSAAIQARGLGYAAAVSLGLKLSARDGVLGEWWLQGMQRAQDDIERKEIQKVIAEWADADSIAAHIGYDIDLFCSRDNGKNTGGKASILDELNRAWLTSTYGVKFVTLTELAELI